MSLLNREVEKKEQQEQQIQQEAPAITPGRLRVIKRNGSVVPYDEEKISIAITKAFLAVSGKIQDSRNKMIELIKVYGMSESDFLKYINQALFSAKYDNLEELSQIIAKYDYRILVGSNPEIQLSAMLAELGKLSK